MPISREQFEQGSDETDSRILELLKSNPDKAYSVNEIAAIVYGDPPADVMEIILRIPRLLIEVGTALDGMVRQGLADRRIVNEITYYRIHPKT